VIGNVYFLTVEEVVAIHADQIDRYGGDAGLGDRGLLDSAVHAAQNVAAYVEDCDLCDLAAAYTFHLAENQPFVDGNKRAALASALVFLHQNGVELDDPRDFLYDVRFFALLTPFSRSLRPISGSRSNASRPSSITSVFSAGGAARSWTATPRGQSCWLPGIAHHPG
jgi:death-on-curing protein